MGEHMFEQGLPGREIIHTDPWRRSVKNFFKKVLTNRVKCGIILVLRGAKDGRCPRTNVPTLAPQHGEGEATRRGVPTRASKTSAR